MSLKQRIDEDLKKAMKARDSAALSATRLLKTEITRQEMALDKPALDDEEVLRLVDKQLRQRKDSAEQFRKGNRPELAEQEEREAAFLAAYLPQRLSPAELELAIDAAIAESGAKSPRDMSAVMKLAMVKTSGRADGKAISELVKKKLSALNTPAVP